ncbi:hypothetical protein [Nostoc sp. DedQUE09]|uniref:hypothetical protein n=1 Tax=Nostoc sp. DedQUE09 TaxID=3075394 RepID=UPI002AD41025|nr:hypothetical protein [Nostoc sp. DedQUE09]MDZ7950268.1 hypothetical protein [Nostoc sp. DedQUE09]
MSYVHVISRLEAETQTQLEKYISGRGEQESNIFQLAQNNLPLQESKQPTNIDFQAESRLRSQIMILEFQTQL